MDLVAYDGPAVKRFSAFITQYNAKDKVARVLQYSFALLGMTLARNGGSKDFSATLKGASSMISQDRKAFKLGHFVNDYRLFGEAYAAFVANSNMVAFSKTGKALCSLLFTSFMNVNWFIKAGLLKWNKKYWGEKQNLVRIWVAIYSLYPSIVAYKRAAGESARQKVEKGRISKEAKSSLFESQLDVFKTVMDFLTYARTTGYDEMLFRMKLPEEIPAIAGILASFLGARSIWRKTKQ